MVKLSTNAGFSIQELYKLSVYFGDFILKLKDKGKDLLRSYIFGIFTDIKRQGDWGQVDYAAALTDISIKTHTSWNKPILFLSGDRLADIYAISWTNPYYKINENATMKLCQNKGLGVIVDRTSSMIIQICENGRWTPWKRISSDPSIIQRKK